MERNNYSEWVETDNQFIRFRIRKTTSEYTFTHYYEFEVYRRPYFFGLLGSKRWIRTSESVNFKIGLSNAKYFLKEYPWN